MDIPFFFKKHNLELISIEPYDIKHIKYICTCGAICVSSLKNLNRKIIKKCNKCSKLISNRNKNYNEHYNYFLKYNCLLLTQKNDYINNKTTIQFKCECNNIETTSVTLFKLSKYKKCSICSKQKSNKEYKSFLDIKEFFSNNNVLLLTKIDEYIGVSNTLLKYLCTCGNTQLVSYHSFKLSKYKKCTKCVKQHIINTNINKFGSKTPAESNIVKEKSKKTCLDKYGVEYPSQLNTVKEKVKETCLNKYGVGNVFKSIIIKEKSKKTCLDKYGVEYPMQSDIIKEKSKKTCLDKYGVEYSLQSNVIKEKSKKTCLDKYGVEHHSQNIDIHKKTIKNAFSITEYEINNKKFILQGYELLGLEILLNTYNITEIENINVPTIKYLFKNKPSVYIPDFYIKKTNTIIEIKSLYTWNLHLIRNILKMLETRKKYNMEVWVFYKCSNGVYNYKNNKLNLIII